MLAALRKSSKSWVIRILFVILIISFAAWGIGDMIQGRSRNAPAISVGDIKISGMEFAQRYESEKRDLRRSRQQVLSDEELRIMGFPQYVAQKMVREALIAQSARDLNMSVTDDTMRTLITEQPAFRDRQGNFDANLYHQFLRNNGMSEAGFLMEQRREIVTQQIRNAVVGGLSAPEAIVDPLFRYMMEKRSAEQIEVPLTAVPVPADPGEEDIQLFHNEHKEDFMAPEYRSLTTLVIRTEDFLPQVEIEEKAIEDSYHQRQNEFRTPERRHLKELVFDSEEDARAAIENSTDKTSLESVAAAAGTAREVADLGWKTQQDILYSNVASTVFSLPLNQISVPLQSPRGWLVYQTTEIEESRPRSIEEVRDNLRKELAHSQAQRLMFEELNNIRDDLGGGATLEEIADQRKLDLVKIEATDAQGLDVKGMPVSALQSLGKQFLQTAFQLESGMDSDLAELNDDTYFDVRVDSITPPELRPLDTVRDQVIVDWKADKRQEEALNLAKTLADRIKAGESFADAAASIEQSVVTSPQITRLGPDNEEAFKQLTLPMLAITTLFDMAEGDVEAVPTENGAVIIRLKDLVPVAPGDSAEVAQQMKLAILQDLHSQIFSEFLQAQSIRYDAQINPGIINRLIGADD